MIILLVKDGEFLQSAVDNVRCSQQSHFNDMNTNTAFEALMLLCALLVVTSQSKRQKVKEKLSNTTCALTVLVKNDKMLGWKMFFCLLKYQAVHMPLLWAFGSISSE